METKAVRKKRATRRGNLQLAVLGIIFCFGLSIVNAAEEPVVGQTSMDASVREQETGNEQSEVATSDADPLSEENEGDDLGTHDYEYQVAARPDPFKPFIAPKTVNPNELVDENLELTGMQLFEPGQLNLVAVMDTPRGRMAMVEDVTKKGYKITQGQLIGRRGQVTEIRKDEVLVTETAYTRGGEEIKTVVSMKMKRDGDSK